MGSAHGTTKAGSEWTVDEILDRLADEDVVVRSVAGELISRGRPGHEKDTDVLSLLRLLQQHFQQDPESVEQHQIAQDRRRPIHLRTEDGT